MMRYSRAERLWLWALAVFGFGGVNAAFLYGILARPEALRDAMANPIAVAFIVEALVLTLAFAYLLSKWKVARLGAGWFIVLSLLGSMAFALPVTLLWPLGKREARTEE